MKVEDCLMSVDVLIRNTKVYYGEYCFYQRNIIGKKGCIIALPFFTYNQKQEQKFEGYLVYHDKDNYGFSNDKLHKFSLEAIIQASLSGMAGKLSPLPYKPICEDKIEELLDEIIQNNTTVNLGGELYF